VVLVIPIAVLFAVFVAVGLASTNSSWSNALVSWLSNSWLNFALPITAFAAQTLKLSQWVAKKLGDLADPLIGMVIQWVSSIRLVTIGLWVSGLEAPVEAFRITSALVWHVIPNSVKAWTLSLTRTVSHTVTVVQHLPGVVVRQIAVSQAQIVSALDRAWPQLTHGYLDSWNWLRRHQKAIAAAIAATSGVLAYPPSLIHDLPVPFGRTIAQIRRRLRALENRAVGAVAVAAVAAALTRLGLNWIRCSNVAKVGKGICRAPLGWIESLLAGLVVVYGVVNIRTLAKELYDLAGFGAREVQHFWGGGVSGLSGNPGLGEIGTVAFLNTDASYTSPNPTLGDVA
jgi:hypothetical protein